MNTIRARNVNDALMLGLGLLRRDDLVYRTAPRGIATREYREAISTLYEKPWECVLFDPVRDANPFFHFFEALWILAGRNDVEFLTRFNKRMAEFSDDGKTFNAPYGERIRNAPCRSEVFVDQLAECIELLKADNTTRQAFIQIWDIEKDLGTKTKDKACNTGVHFLIRSEALRMTVFNRSNDVIWGAYGANAVQFAFVQKYVADKVGVGIGPYTQVSDSYHVYEDNPFWIDYLTNYQPNPNISNYYRSRPDEAVPALLSYTFDDLFDGDLLSFFEIWNGVGGRILEPAWADSLFFANMVVPMWNAHHRWAVERDAEGSMRELGRMLMCDWRLACKAWLRRRINKSLDKAMEQL